MISYGKAKWKRKKEDRWRDQKEPRQTVQKKDNAPNNQLKKSQKMEDIDLSVLAASVRLLTF
jgi:hypothetical protein